MALPSRNVRLLLSRMSEEMLATNIVIMRDARARSIWANEHPVEAAKPKLYTIQDLEAELCNRVAPRCRSSADANMEFHRCIKKAEEIFQIMGGSL